MGGGGVPRGGPPNQTAYFVALACILFLLLLLCCYFCYFFVKRVIELSGQDLSSATPSCQPRPPASYPVHQEIRDSATAMAKLCKQLPPPPGKGDTVFPTSTSPAALQTDTGPVLSGPALEGPAVPLGPVPQGPPATELHDKLPAPPIVVVSLDVEAR